MPRKKHPFINRAKARTYQLVHRAGADSDNVAPVLVPVETSASSLNQTGLNADDLGAYQRMEEIDGEALVSYRKADFELGEFGFADDGYDYSKHFKTIGGSGGVFMDAVTGMPNPEAVTGESRARGAAASATDIILLKEDIDKLATEDVGMETWRRKEDFLRHQKAIEAIKKERKRNKDLDQVIAALDSDGELDSNDVEEDGIDIDELLLQSDDDGILEDDFIATANKANDIVEDTKDQLDGVLEEYREPRLLDEQFEKFMKGYAYPDNEEDGDEDYFPSADLADVNDLGEFEAHLTNEEMENVFDKNGLLDGFSGLKITVEEEKDTLQDRDQNDHLAALPGPSDAAVSRTAEFQEFADAEFERGMKGLLDSYNRVSAVEALEAIDGVDVALEAIARAEEQEKAKIDQRINDGLDEESDGHDSELEAKLDEMFAEPEEKWDCETILSTYSNLDNHPSVIDAPIRRKQRSVQKQPVIRLDPRTQAPADYMPMSMSGGGGPMDFGSRREGGQEVHTRSRNESKEQKKARKAAVKEAARERRALKSEMKKAFGSEQNKQSRHATAMGTSKVAVQF